MKKLIITASFFLSIIICYVMGYIWATKGVTPQKVKERAYKMESTIPVINEELTYILYPMYGEVLIYQSDGSFYDSTGLWLCELSRQDRIEILNRKRVFTKEELDNYLEYLSK